MKRPEYVAAAVTAYRNAIDGKDYDAETLKAVFSRNGFTDGYFTEKYTGYVRYPYERRRFSRKGGSAVCQTAL